MTLSNTTYLKCDAIINGKPCGRVFSLPDDAQKNTPGVEHTVGITISATNQTYHFCNMEHLLRFALEWIKASRVVPKETRTEDMAELETIPRNMPMENLNLGDN